MKKQENRYVSDGADVLWDTKDGKPPRKKVDYRAETKRVIKKTAKKER